MLKLPAYLTGFSSKVDGSASVRFNTQELTPDHFSSLKTHLNGFGWLVFDETASDKDVPKEAPVEEGLKSSSVRLRNVLFVIFNSKFPDKKDFETYYRKRMETIIEKLKEELN